MNVRQLQMLKLGVGGTSDSEDNRVVTAVARALKPGGRFLLDVANRERIFRDDQERRWRHGPGGTLVLTSRELDLATGRHRVTDLYLRPDGSREERWHQFRFYALSELAAMLAQAGPTVEKTWGGFDGSPTGWTAPA